MQVQMLWVLIQQDEFKSFFANTWGNTFAWETIVASTRCSEICGVVLLKHITHLIVFCKYESIALWKLQKTQQLPTQKLSLIQYVLKAEVLYV